MESNWKIDRLKVAFKFTAVRVILLEKADNNVAREKVRDALIHASTGLYYYNINRKQ